MIIHKQEISKILWHAQSSQWAQNSIFPKRKILLFPIQLHKFLKFKEMEYVIHYVKLKMRPALFYVNYPFYFQQRDLM